MSYDALFVNPTGRTSRADFLPALITVSLAIAFFAYVVTGRTAHFCMLVLMYPTFVLLARRMRDSGLPATLLLLPLLVTLVAFGVKLAYFSLSPAIDPTLPWAALLLTAAFALLAAAKK